MKNLLILSLVLLVPSLGFSLGLESHQEAEALPGVVLIQIELDKKNIKLQTGFFYSHDRVITNVSVDSSVTPDACAKIFISAADFDKTTHDIAREYKCVEDLLVDHTLGFRAFKVERLDGSEARSDFIPLDTKTRLSTASRNKKFELAGFTVDKVLMHSTNCEVIETAYQPDKSVTASRPTLKFDKYGWLRGNCITQSGMNGSPILLNGKVIGVASGVTRQMNIKGKHHDELVWSQMVTIAKYHDLMK